VYHLLSQCSRWIVSAPVPFDQRAQHHPDDSTAQHHHTLHFISLLQCIGSFPTALSCRAKEFSTLSEYRFKGALSHPSGAQLGSAIRVVPIHTCFLLTPRTYIGWYEHTFERFYARLLIDRVMGPTLSKRLLPPPHYHIGSLLCFQRFNHSTRLVQCVGWFPTKIYSHTSPVLTHRRYGFIRIAQSIEATFDFLIHVVYLQSPFIEIVTKPSLPTPYSYGGSLLFIIHR